MIEQNGDFKNNNICRFCEKNNKSVKVRDHCHLTGKYRVPAHSKCFNTVTQDIIHFIPVVFCNFSNHDCHTFFEKLVDRKNDKIKLDIIPKTNEEFIGVTFGCIRFVDSYRFLSSSLDSLVKTLVDYSHRTLKHFEEEIVENDEILNIVNEVKKSITEGKYKSDSIKDLKKDNPDKIKELEEA